MGYILEATFLFLFGVHDVLDTSRFCFGSGFVVVQSQVFSMKYMCKWDTKTFVTSDDTLSTDVQVNIEACFWNEKQQR